MQKIRFTVVLAGLVMSAAACTGPSSTTASGSTPSTAPTSATPADGGNAAGSDTGTGSAAGTGSGSGTAGGTATRSGTGSAGRNSPGRAGVPECRTNDLKVSLRSVPGNYAGSALRSAARLVFTNVSGRTCSEQGYPGVSFVAGADGTQVGRGFIRDAATTRPVTLTAGGQAHATIVVTNAPNACRPVQVRGYRVIPPDQVTSVFVSAPQYACRDAGQADGHIQPITAGV